MNDSTTASELILAARDLFVARGYDGTSIRAITAKAGANLGAVTYHFGSKEALYDAVAAAVSDPLREHIRAASERPGTPLEKLETLVRSFFDYLWDHPEVPGFMVQHLASSRPPPPSLRTTIEANMAVLSSLIDTGQAAGSIREGNSRLLALSIVAQPIWLTLVRRLLAQTLDVNQERPQERTEVIDTAVTFILAGLTSSDTRP
jgi:AcrR family transcriptional regulator